MLYEELIHLTDNKATYWQYDAVEKVYMESERMTKQEAADLWYKTYGPRTYRKWMADASRLSYAQTSRHWNELHGSGLRHLHDPETGWTFTLIHGHHRLLKREILTLALVLGGDNRWHVPVVFPMRMSDFGENESRIWSEAKYIEIVWLWKASR